MSEIRFPIFDGDYKPDVDVIDGLPQISAKRDVIEELTLLEPVDDRNDYFATVPVRSVWNPACGPAVEIGPFSLDDAETVKLYNALAKHISTFSSCFHTRSDSA